MPEEQYHFFAMWEYGALLELSRCDGFRPDPRWIASKLVPRVTQKRVQRVMNDLIALKLLGWTADGRLVPQDDMINDNWNADAEVRRKALLKRNLWSLKQAARAVVEIPADQRHFSTLTFCGNERHLQVIRQCLDRCMLRIAEISETDLANADQVFELDVQLFPLSQSTRTDPEE